MRWPWSSTAPSSQDTRKPVAWSETLNATDWAHYTDPRNVISVVLLTGTILGSYTFYRSYLRRIPGTAYIKPGAFRSRSLFGTVTRVGDGDNFHLFHTPLGRLAGWEWARKVPDWKPMSKNTIPIRIAGVDAPEAAHFGKEAQPHSAESLLWLRNFILNRRVRVYIYRRDQYERVVGRVVVRRWIFRHDLGYEMLKAGMCTVYDAKSGAEFGELEHAYRAAEKSAKDAKKGIWSARKFESPRAYKIRTAVLSGDAHDAGKQKKESSLSSVGTKIARFFRG